MDFFKDHAVLFALLCSGVAILYGLYLVYWLLSRPAGSERMQEIARAVQEGAAAYLRKQYTTIAIVAVVPFLLLGFYNKLGWGTAIGFLIGAGLSAAAGFIGMNVAVRSNVRTAEAAKEGLKPALDVAFRAGSVTYVLTILKRPGCTFTWRYVRLRPSTSCTDRCAASLSRWANVLPSETMKSSVRTLGVPRSG